MRNLADPIKVDSADPADPMGQLAVLLLALFAQMERSYTCEWAAHARAVAAAHGRQVGRPSLPEPAVLAYAAHLRDAGDSMAQIVAETGMTRSSLYQYQYLPPRPPVAVTAAQRDEGVTGAPAGTATAGAAVGGLSSSRAGSSAKPSGARAPAPKRCSPFFR